MRTTTTKTIFAAAAVAAAATAIAAVLALYIENRKKIINIRIVFLSSPLLYISLSLSLTCVGGISCCRSWWCSLTGKVYSTEIADTAKQSTSRLTIVVMVVGQQRRSFFVHSGQLDGVMMHERQSVQLADPVPPCRCGHRGCCRRRARTRTAAQTHFVGVVVIDAVVVVMVSTAADASR